MGCVKSAFEKDDFLWAQLILLTFMFESSMVFCCITLDVCIFTVCKIKLFSDYWKVLNGDTKEKGDFPVSFQSCCFLHLAVSKQPAYQHSNWITIFQVYAAFTLKHSCSSQGTSRMQAALLLCSVLAN